MKKTFISIFDDCNGLFQPVRCKERVCEIK